MRSFIAFMVVVVPALNASASPGHYGCGTPEQIRRFRAGEPVRELPSSVDVLDSAYYPLRFHFPAYPTILPSEAAAIMLAMERAWFDVVVVRGFDPPPPEPTGGNDSLDFYIEELASQGAAGMTVPLDIAWSETDRFAVTSYISLDPSVGLDCLTIAHEFHHAIQFGYDAAEDPAFFENTSVYMQGLVCNDEVYADWFLDAFQAEPQRPVDYFAYATPYQYGGYVFLQFLSEAYFQGDADVVRRLWDGTKQPSQWNEPDYLDVAGALLQTASGADLWDALALFSEWRLVAGNYDDGDHFSNGYKWTPGNMVAIQKTHNAVGAIENATLDGTSETGMAYIALENILGLDLQVDFSIEGSPGTRWAARAICLPDGSGSAQITEAGSTGQSIAFSFDIRDFHEKAVVAVVGLGDMQHDPDSDDWQTSPFAYSFTVTKADEGEGDDDGDEPADAGVDGGDDGDDGDCDCGTSGVRGMPGLVALLATGLRVIWG